MNAPSPCCGRLLFASESFPRNSGSGSQSSVSRASCMARAGVLDDLDGLDPGELVEEPAAARVHQHGVPLELQQLESQDFLAVVQPLRRMPIPEARAARLCPIQDDVDVIVSRSPGVLQQGPRAVLVPWGQRVAKPVQRVAQRCPPRLAPARVHPRAAAAVVPPALHSVGAAPRALLEDLGPVGGWIPVQVLGVVGEPREPFRLDVLQRVTQSHVAVGMMMPVRLPVGGDRDELGARAVIREPAHEPVGEQLPVVEQPLERHRPRDRAVVEEDVDAAARWQSHLVGYGRIDAATADVTPRPRPGPAYPARLVGREDREPDPLLGQDVEALEIGRGLGEPHPLGPPAEPVLEVANAPGDLRPAIAAVRERQDHVVVHLRDGGAMAGESSACSHDPPPGSPRRSSATAPPSTKAAWGRN